MKKAISIFTVIIILAILTGLIASFFVYKNDRERQAAEIPFVITTDNGMQIRSDCSLKFASGCVYTFTTNKEYDFAILPNTSYKSNDFTFTIDGANKQFFSELGLYFAFDVTTTKNSISIGVPDNATVKSLIQRIYTHKEIVMPEEFENSIKAIFTLQLKERRGKTVYYINFGIIDFTINLPERIIF